MNEFLDNVNIEKNQQVIKQYAKLPTMACKIKKEKKIVKAAIIMHMGKLIADLADCNQYIHVVQLI